MTLRRLLQSFPLCVALAVGQAPHPSNRGSSIILPPEEFTEAALLKRCRPLQTDKSVSFADFWFFSSRDDAGAFLLGKPGNYFPYDSWRRNYEKAVAARMQIAEFVRISDSSILLIRHSDATVVRRVLSGEDPLVLDINGTRLNLLHFTTTPLQAGSNQRRISVYAQTAASMKPNIGAAALEALVGKLPFPEVVLHVREDPWFINDTAFPVLPPFWPGFPPLTKEQYSQSPELFCSPTASGTPKCVLSSRHDY